MKIKLVVFSILLFQSVQGFCQWPGLNWGGYIEPSSNQVTYFQIDSDKDNNFFYLDVFTGLVEFGLLPGEISHNCGTNEYVLVKRNPTGRTEWILPLSGAKTAGFAVDSEGNTVMMLSCAGTTNINPNGAPVIVTGNRFVLVKYGTNGQLIWYKSGAVPSQLLYNSYRFFIEIGLNDKIACAGHFNGSVDFDFGAGTNIQSPQLSKAVFVGLYSKNGDLIWMDHLQSVQNLYISDIDINNNDFVYFAGGYKDSVFVEPQGANTALHASIENPSGTNDEAFIAGFGPTGTLSFARTFQNSDFLDIRNIHANNLNLYILNDFQTNVNLNPNPGTPFYGTLTGNCLRLSASTSTYFTHYNLSGTQVSPRSMTITPDNTFIITGTHILNADFDPGPGTVMHNPGTGSDYFISEFSSSFSYLGTRFLEADVSPFQNGARRTPNGALCFFGQSFQTVNLDYSGGSSAVTSVGSTYTPLLSYYTDNLPEANVVDVNGFGIASGSTVADTINSTYFGELCSNDYSERTFYMINSGVSDLVVNSISVSGPVGQDYLVTNNTGLIPSGDTLSFVVSILATDLGLNEATVTVSCNDPDESTYTFKVESFVHPNPTVGYSSNPSTNSFCAGDLITLTGTGAINYAWNNGVIDNVPFVLNNSGTYAVTGTNQFGCSDSIEFNLIANPLPVVSVTSDVTNNEVCLNDPVQLSGSGAVNYSYTNSVVDQTDFYPISTMTYVVTGTDVNGCQDTASITIVVNSLPNVDVSSNDTDNEICMNDSIQLVGSGASSYSYSNGVTDMAFFSPNMSETIYISGTDQNGCVGEDSLMITVNQLPNVTVSSSDADNEVCANDSIQLIGSGAQTYSYSGGVVDQVYFSPTLTETYFVSGIDNNGCVNDTSIQIVVNDLPTVDAGSNVIVCYEDSTELLGVGNGTMIWNDSISNGSYFPYSTGNSQLICSSVSTTGCTSSDTIYIFGSPQIDVNISISGQYTLNAAPNYSSYAFYDCLTNTILQDSPQNTFNVPSNSEYFVIITNADNCIDSSDCIVIDDLGGTEIVSTKTHIFPNPTDKFFQVTTDIIFSEIRLFTSGGKLVEAFEKSDHYDVSMYQSGVYFIEFVEDSVVLVRRKIIIQ